MEGLALEAFVNDSLEFYAKVREQHNITITSLTKEVIDGLVICTAIGSMPARKDGNFAPGERTERSDSASGAVSIEGLTGIAKADAFKSAETQAKSRLTISLSGIRCKTEQGPAQPEPAFAELPTVNAAPAVVEVDTRVDLPGVIVTESAVAAMHREADKLAAQVPDVANSTAPSVAVATIAAGGQASIFDEPAPETLVVPQAPQVVVPAPVVDAVLAAVQPPTATGVSMPVAVPKPADQPTRLQYQGFTTRCTKLVRDVLPKAGKDAPALLLPYLRKVFGVKDLNHETTSISLWESTLGKIENAGSPAAMLSILKGN